MGRHRKVTAALTEPLHVAAYVEGLGRAFEKPTVKQHLAAIRILFDWLVTGHVVAINLASSVRGAKASRQHRYRIGGRPARPLPLKSSALRS